MNNTFINKLINYGIKNEMFDILNKDLIINNLLRYFKLDNYTVEVIKEVSLDNILSELSKYYEDNNLLDKDINFDMFSTEVISFITAQPSEVINKFEKLYNQNIKQAINYYHKFSIDTNYIKKKEVQKNIKFKTNSKYGILDITINLSKPEKDPKEIAKMLNTKKTDFPKCLLCKENVGVYGKLNYPARLTHRIIPITLDNNKFYLQYSPYEYYNEHAIVLSDYHTPMTITKQTLKYLLDFVDLFPHYFIGSNSDIPIVGGSILSHEHFQAGNYTFAMDKATSLYTVVKDNVEINILNWPLSVVRLKSNNKEEVLELAGTFLNKFINYNNEYIISKTDVRHNAITPIVRFNKGYEVDLVLRNNITTEQRPDGLYHPRAEYHHIKKENIGLIEVMGLAVLPARLEKELNEIKEVITNNKPLSEALINHKEWLDYLIKKYNNEDIDEFINQEVGIRFEQVLEDCGIFNNKLEDFKHFVLEVIK